jgi:hypothetical protein
MTTPSGKLAWGQSGVYDAIDDRTVIAAVTRNRTGLAGVPTVTAGAGLALTVKGGWLGVASCGDGTSAVVGSRVDLSVTGNAGPASGTRTDLVWCDVQPDSGTWSLAVIAQSAAAGRTGLPLATLLVPANATLASQMTITPQPPMLEKRLLSYTNASNTSSYNQSTWATAGFNLDSSPVLMIPGNWYRVRFWSVATCVLTYPGSAVQMEGRAGIGYRTTGQPLSSATEVRAVAIPWTPNYNLLSTPVAVEYNWQHAPTDTMYQKTFNGRIWAGLSGATYRAGNQNWGEPGPIQVLTVEDMGS